MKVSLVCLVYYLAMPLSHGLPSALDVEAKVVAVNDESIVASADAIDDATKNNNDVVDSRLRGSQAVEAALLSLQNDDDFQDVPDVLDSIGELTSSQRVDHAVTLQSKLKIGFSKLTEVDMMAMEAGVTEFASIIHETQAHLQKVEKPVAAIVQLLRNGEPEDRSNRHLVALDGLEDRTLAGQDNLYQHVQRNKTTSYNRKQEKSAHYRRMFDEQRERTKTVFRGHIHEKLVDIQEAIHNGDHSTIKSFTDSLFQSHYSRFGKKDMGTAAGGHRRRLSKTELCSTLVTCASRMSKYDLFVYFHSDDIDATSGAMDENRVRYDEKDLDKKYKKIKELTETGSSNGSYEKLKWTQNADRKCKHRVINSESGCLKAGIAHGGKAKRARRGGNSIKYVDPEFVEQDPCGCFLDEDGFITLNKDKKCGTKARPYSGFHRLCKADGQKQGTCDDLLQQFHRTKEHGNVPSWEGATVGQVCLAEGTTTFLKLEDAAVALSQRPPLDSTTKDTLSNLFEKTAKGYTDLVSTFIVEPLACAEAIYKSGAGIREQYPFGKDGESPRLMQDGGMDNVRFPTFKDKEDYPNINLPQYLVVSQGLVQGGYHNSVDDAKTALEKAKNEASSSTSQRMAVEFIDGVASEFPIIINGEEQDTSNGWYKYWWGWDSINNMVRIAEDFVAANPSKPTVGFSMDITKQTKARDRHGQIKNKQESAFNFVSYPYLEERYQKCARDLGRDLAEDVLEKEEKKEKYDLKKMIEEDFFEPFYGKCLGGFFASMREGIEVVFGDRTSTGFICGMKETIVKDGQKLPGTCCLDAPYELEGDDWGRKYQCPVPGETSKCKNFGPYFSGMSTQACDSYGGTWCPNKADCSILKRCIETHKEDAQATKRPSFFQYLDSAPVIENPEDSKQCGKTREYFGFDEYFSNDAQVCEDLEQLQHMRDFSFLDEFYGVGGDAEEDEEIEEVDAVEVEEKKTETIAPGQAGEQPNPPTVEIMKLTPADHSASNDPKVLSGQAWRSINFAFKQLGAHFKTAVDLADNVPCPDLPFVGTFPCELLKTVIKGILYILSKVHGVLHALSEFLYGEMATLFDNEAIIEFEFVKAIKPNMEETGVYLQKQFDATNTYLYDSFVALYADIQKKNEAQNDYLHELISGAETSMTDKTNALSDYIDKETEVTHDELGKIKESIGDVEKDVKKIVAGISFDMQVVVASKKAKSFIVVTTGVDGEPTKPDFFDIESVSASGYSKVVPESKFKAKNIGSVGRRLITLDASIKTNIFFVTAGLHEGNSDDELVTKIALLSFD